MAVTTSSVLPAPVQQSFSYKLLSVPVPNMIHKIPAMKKNMPRNGGTTLRMRRYNALNTALVPLGNSGVTPPAQQLSAVDIDAKIDFYGTYVQLNEQVTLQNQDPSQLQVQKGIQMDLTLYTDQCNKDSSLNRYGVYKPSLMDLKPLTGSAEGNKAEPVNGTVNAVSEKAPIGDAVL